jgi:hypothetical protein
MKSRVKTSKLPNANCRTLQLEGAERKLPNANCRTQIAERKLPNANCRTQIAERKFAGFDATLPCTDHHDALDTPLSTQGTFPSSQS